MTHLSDDGFACDLNAFTPAQREHHIAHSRALFGAALDARELPDGYAVRLADAPDILAQLADFVWHERLCCPFLRFQIEAAPYHGPVWLTMTGPDGIKPLLAEELLAQLPPDVAARAA